jgi:DNA polymerase (family X)
MTLKEDSNDDIADVLDRIADLLDAKDANPHRVRAYRDGATSVRNTHEPITDWVREGEIDRLHAFPGIGSGLSRVIANIREDRPFGCPRPPSGRSLTH